MKKKKCECCSCYFDADGLEKVSNWDGIHIFKVMKPSNSMDRTFNTTCDCDEDEFNENWKSRAISRILIDLEDLQVKVENLFSLIADEEEAEDED